MQKIIQLKQSLRERIQATGHHPFLFVGSGFTCRYMSTERWDGLLKYLCSLLPDDPIFRYNYYASKSTTTEYYGKQPQIAKFLSEDFNEAVFKSPRFETFRQKHTIALQEGIAPLKIAIAEHLHSAKLNNEYPAEIEMLQKLSIRSISGIITTNYDNLLETLFPKFKTYTGQEELIFANLAGIGEIYKIHGSVDKPGTIVITDSDYKSFDELSAYLIAKVLTIFLEYPIIFLGYSINDKNIQNILQTISRCLSQEKLDILKDRFIFIDFADGDVITEKSFHFEGGNHIHMTQVSTRNFLTVYQAIYEVKSTYSPSVLRRLRRDIYDMALENKPTERIVATGFENLDSLSPDTNLILGIGVSQTGHLIKAEQLYEDVIRDNKYLNPALVVEEYLPELLKSNSGGLPMFKYLQGYTKETYGAIKAQLMKRDSVDAFLNDSLRKSKRSYRALLAKRSVQEIINREGDVAYRRLFLLEATEFDLSLLRDYISNVLGDAPAKVLHNNSELKRLIRIYDFLKYKTASPQNAQ